MHSGAECAGRHPLCTFDLKIWKISIKIFPEGGGLAVGRLMLPVFTCSNLPDGMTRISGNTEPG